LTAANSESASDAVSGRAARWTCTLIALAAGYCVLHGLLHWDVLNAHVAERIAMPTGLPRVQPPLVFSAVCILFLIAIAMVLAWYTASSASARRLSLFVALLAFGYATIFNGEALLELLFTLTDKVLSLDISKPLKRVAISLELLFGSLLEFPAWTIAGAVLLRFLSEFPSVHSAPPPWVAPPQASAWRVALLAALTLPSLLYAAALPLHTPESWLWECGLAASAWLGWTIVRCFRTSLAPKTTPPDRPATSGFKRAMLAAGSVLLGVGLLSLEEGSGQSSNFDTNLRLLATAFAGVALVATLPLALARIPKYVYVPASILVISYLIMRQFGRTLPNFEPDQILVHPWLLACSLLSIFLAISRLPQSSPQGRTQSLIILSGITLAAIVSIAWGLGSVVYAVKKCSTPTSVTCTVLRYKDWLFELPGLIIAAFFATSIMFPGDIDAEKLFRRTSLYGALAALLVVGFAIVEYVIGELFGHLMPENMPRTIAVGAVALAVHPAKTRVERTVDALLKRILALNP
jgi:hypothetical protein